MNDTELRARVRGSILARHYQDTGALLIPVTVSNRHIHLDERSLFALFGEGYRLTHKKDLVQIGQYAAEETVTLRTQKAALGKVRVLGPLRSKTQVELSTTDCYTLGIKPAIHLSGDLAGTPGIRIEGPRGAIDVSCGAMVAKRHVHVPSELAGIFGLQNGDTVSLVTKGERPSVLMGFIVRVSDEALLEAHVDTDEANAAGITNDMLLTAIKEGA